MSNIQSDRAQGRGQVQLDRTPLEREVGLVHH